MMHCQLVSPHNAMQCHTQHATSMSSKSSPLGTRSAWGLFLFQRNTHVSPRHRCFCSHETQLMMHVGLSCIQGVVIIACRESLLLHSSPLGRHGRQEDHRHVPFQASCHPSPRNNCYWQNHQCQNKTNHCHCWRPGCTSQKNGSHPIPSHTPTWQGCTAHSTTTKHSSYSSTTLTSGQRRWTHHHLESSTCSACLANPQLQHQGQQLRLQHSCNCQGQRWQRCTCSQSTHPITLSPSHLPIPKPSSHMKSIETTLCAYGQLSHHRRELMHTHALCTCPHSLHCGYAFAAECILLETISPPSHPTIHFISAIIHDNTSNVLKYGQLMKIDKHKTVSAHSFANEIGQLFHGIRNVPGTDKCFFIPKSLVPAHTCPTYGCICCNYQPQKEEKHCIRLTIGGN